MTNMFATSSSSLGFFSSLKGSRIHTYSANANFNFELDNDLNIVNRSLLSVTLMNGDSKIVIPSQNIEELINILEDAIDRRDKFE